MTIHFTKHSIYTLSNKKKMSNKLNGKNKPRNVHLWISPGFSYSGIRNKEICRIDTSPCRKRESHFVGVRQCALGPVDSLIVTSRGHK